MNRKGAWVFWISIILVIFLIAFLFLYLALFNSNNKGVYSGRVIENPVLSFSDEQAISEFNENFVFYLLYDMKAYNLHNPPLSSDYPRIEINVGGEIFSASVKGGEIFVSDVQILDKDIVIRTTKEEAVKMMRDENYVSQSFNDGKSSIELAASKTSLFAKGYLNFYNGIIGKSITGNLIRIATD
jgi:hypothetical protein